MLKFLLRRKLAKLQCQLKELQADKRTYKSPEQERLEAIQYSFIRVLKYLEYS